MKQSRLVSVTSTVIIGIIIIIIFEILVGSFNTEGWNPVVTLFGTVIFPIVIVAGIVIAMMKMFIDDKIESNESAGVLNPIVLLVRKIRGQKTRTPEELSAIMDKKMAEELFTNQPLEDNEEIWEKGHKEYGNSSDIDTKTGTIRNPMNPIVHLVRHIRHGESR